MEEKGKKKKSSKFQIKVLLGILVPVIVFCLITNIIISVILGYQLMQKKENIEKEYLSVLWSQMEETKTALDVLALRAENSFSVKWALNGEGFDTTEKKKYALSAQKSLTASLEGSNVSDYVSQMILLNKSGSMISITSIPYRLSAETIFLSAIFKDKQEEKVKVGLAESVVDPGEVRLVYIYPLDKEDGARIVLFTWNWIRNYLENYFLLMKDLQISLLKTRIGVNGAGILQKHAGAFINSIKEGKNVM